MESIEGSVERWRGAPGAFGQRLGQFALGGGGRLQCD